MRTQTHGQFKRIQGDTTLQQYRINLLTQRKCKGIKGAPALVFLMLLMPLFIAARTKQGDYQYPHS